MKSELKSKNPSKISDEKREAMKEIERILIDGTIAERLELFGFDFGTPRPIIKKKFKLFIRGCYPRYIKVKAADFHDDCIDKFIESYIGRNDLIAGFRGCSKTSLKKLFDVFMLLNDRDAHRKYMKVLTRDGKNSRQIVTDVYNLIVEVRNIYGNPFEQQGDIKREETMNSFTTKDGRKYAAGTVGQVQRGHVQDAHRPDWVWFEDVEDRESIKSVVITQGIIDRCAEAIDGLSMDGSYFVTCNYISDQGVVQWFMDKSSVHSLIIPLLRDDKDFNSSTWPEAYPEDKVRAIFKDADDFYGEFQCDPQKSENKFFDFERINEDLKKCVPPKRTSAGVRYWDDYKPNHRYGMGSDHSEGVGLDSNAMALWDFSRGKLVASYANNMIAPDLSVHEFTRVGAEFGNCIYAPEVNNKCGGTAITTAKAIGYPSIYKYRPLGNTNEKVSHRLGWETNSKTKYNAFYEFRTDYNDGLIEILDADLLKEMKAYTNSDLNDETAGLITRHFDLLTAAVIGYQMKKHAVISRENTKKSYGKAMDTYLDSID